MTIWTPATQQAETWTEEEEVLVHAFDPYSFDRLPSFDTGSTKGIWDAATVPAEVWTPQ